MNPFNYIIFFMLLSGSLAGQSVNLKLRDFRICNNQMGVELLLSASEFANDTFSIGSSSVFLNYDGEKIRFNQYTPAAFDPEYDERAIGANWEEHKFDFNDEYGIFHLVLQKNDGGENNYLLKRDTSPIKIGTIIFDFWEGGSLHDISINFPFTKFNDDIANDGSNEILLENASSLEVLNDTVLWQESFDDMADGTSIDTSETAWSVDSSRTNAKSPDHFIGIQSGEFVFKALDGEAVWRSDWIDLCGNAVNISMDVRERGTMEEDDYIRAYYEVLNLSENETLEESEVMFGSLEGELPEGSDFVTFATEEKVTGDLFRIIVRARNGFNGNFEQYLFDNLMLSTADCFQQVRPKVESIEDDVAAVSWNPDFKAVSYKLLYRIRGEETWDPLLSNNVFEIETTTNEGFISDLQANTSYEFQVQSVCETAAAPFSEVMTFATDNCPNFDNNLIGTQCNDGNPQTQNDVYQNDCRCRGQFVLPIELLYFYATPEETQVELEWATASEINNDYFTVQRSADGVEWQEIEKILGAGTSTEPLTYYTSDPAPLPGTSYYRLKQTDYDGQTSFSDIATVSRAGNAYAQLDVYPNPTSGLLSIKAPADASFELIDSFGKIIRSGVLPSTELDISTLPNGVYTLAVYRSNGKRHIERIVKE